MFLMGLEIRGADISYPKFRLYVGIHTVEPSKFMPIVGVWITIIVEPYMLPT
jgi:hypothetical protein